jgi:ribosomal protein S18 acetylase RimI-like enzyme
MKHLKGYNEELTNREIEYEIVRKSNNIELIDKSGTERIGQVTLDQKGSVCHLVGINVFGSYQGKGFSKILMDESVMWAKERDCSMIYLDVSEYNSHAIRLYKLNGFILSRQKSKLGSSFVVMIKSL